MTFEAFRSRPIENKNVCMGVKQSRILEIVFYCFVDIDYVSFSNITKSIWVKEKEGG